MPGYIAEVIARAHHRSMSGRLRRSLRKNLPLRRLGAFRTVFITRRYVFKLPGQWRWDGRGWWWEFLLRGLLSNMQEREFAQEDWPELCPVRFSIPGGFLVVMPRARPLTSAEWASIDYRAFVTRGDGYVEENFDKLAHGWQQGEPGQPLYSLVGGDAEPPSGLVPVEYKRDSFGVLDGRIVAVDYG
jgi:hypothetical protein